MLMIFFNGLNKAFTFNPSGSLSRLKRKPDDTRSSKSKEDISKPNFQTVAFLNTGETKEPTEEEIKKEIAKLQENEQFKATLPDAKRLLEEHLNYLKLILEDYKKKLNEDIKISKEDINSYKSTKKDIERFDKERKTQIKVLILAAENSIKRIQDLITRIENKSPSEIKEIFEKEWEALGKAVSEEFENLQVQALRLLSPVLGKYLKELTDYKNIKEIQELIAIYNLKADDDFSIFNRYFPYRERYSSIRDEKALKSYEAVANMIQQRILMTYTNDIKFGPKGNLEINNEKKLDPILSRLIATHIAELFHKSPELLFSIAGNNKRLTPLRIVIADDVLPMANRDHGYGGFYFRNRHLILVDKEEIFSGLQRDSFVSALHHEIGHALTSDLVNKYETSEVLLGMEENDKKRYVEIVDKLFKITSGEEKRKLAREMMKKDLSDEKYYLQRKQLIALTLKALILNEVLRPYSFTDKREFTPETITRMLKNPEAFQTDEDLKIIYEILSRYFNIDPLNDLKDVKPKEMKIKETKVHNALDIIA